MVEHLFRTFLTLFRQKNYLGGLEKRTKQKPEQKAYKQAINYSFTMLPRSAQKLKWTLLLYNFSLKSQQMVPNYSLYSYKCPDFHLRKILPQFWANKHLNCASDAINSRLHTNEGHNFSKWGIWRKEPKLCMQYLMKPWRSYSPTPN